MKSFFSSLATVIQEFRILGEALDKNREDPINLPNNYWRSELAACFLRRSKGDLPRPFRLNFCPLFWFTNLLVLTLPIWGVVYGFIWLALVIADITVIPLTNLLTSRSLVRNTARLRESQLELRARIKTITFVRSNVDYSLFKAGQLAIKTLPLDMAYAGVVTPAESENFDYNRIDILEYASLAQAYYLSFMRQFPDRIEAEALDITQEAQQRFTEAARIAEIAERTRRMKVANRIAKCKTVCKILLIIVAIPVTMALAVGLWVLAIKAYYGIGWLWWVLIVENLRDTLICTTMIIAGVSIPLTIALSIRANPARGAKVSNFIGDLICLCVYPIFLLATGICFCGRLIKMFYSENCPAIVFNDDEKV